MDMVPALRSSHQSSTVAAKLDKGTFFGSPLLSINVVVCASRLSTVSFALSSSQVAFRRLLTSVITIRKQGNDEDEPYVSRLSVQDIVY